MSNETENNETNEETEAKPTITIAERPAPPAPEAEEKPTITIAERPAGQ
ncbi:MAG: hypothetical protein H7070_05890 [Saprospiraceae bacterium]|nr:hypothetical protein [Pyrinomonadaceae bacterium]